MDQHSNRYLLADMLLIGRTLPEILMARGTLIFLLHLGFVINLRKVVLHPVKQIEFMGLVKNTEKMTLALSEKKLKRVSTMSGDFHAAENFSLKSHRVNWPVVINCPDHFTSTNAVSTGANISSTQKGSYSGHVALVNLAREELHWWMENLELCHGRKPETGTPYDHSDMSQQKAWGILQGIFGRVEMVKGGEAFSHKCSRIAGIKICNPNFHKEFVTLEHSCSSREQTCSAIFFEDGWYPQSTPFKNQQVNLDLSTISSDHNYCRVPPKQVEYQTRLGVRVQECKTYPIGNYIEKFI